YVADYNNHAIRKIAIATGAVSTLAGGAVDPITGLPRLGWADGVGAATQFFYPAGITTDGVNLYVADSGNDRIRKVEIATGNVTTLAGSTRGFADGTGAAANFSVPTGITTDGANLYVADTANSRIRKVVIATGAVTTLAGDGAFGFADGVGVAARFNAPSGLTTDGANLYVADTTNNRIRKIVIASGNVSTLAGSGLARFVDGVGAAAGFNLPQSISSDGTHLFVADTSNSLIRKIQIATGTVTTLAGDVVGGYADGIGAAAKFNLPRGITTDGTYLYVADSSNNRIRKIH
ncbi:MAG: hypothetical protein C0406_08035, partial [Sideroxydans sp.]|nr:hypothetical protein [Sideroxydans sp.]